MKQIDTIRAALERALEVLPTYAVTHARLSEALAALAELERAATEPVAWMWNDMLGIPQVYASQKRPTWPDAGSSPAMAVAINVRPLYTAPPPAPVAEMREEMARKDDALSEIITMAERRNDCTDILNIARNARLPEAK